MARLLKVLVMAMILSWIAVIRTDGFSENAIQGKLFAEVEERAPSEVLHALHQPFRYFAKGRQAFVFVSNDEQYVLKFFNKKYLQVPWYAFFYRDKERIKREIRNTFYRDSYRIAKAVFGEEILYLHLGASQDLPKVEIIDRASGAMCLDLNRTPFVLQRKGILLYDYLEEVYEKEGIRGIERWMEVFLKAVAARIGKGLGDGDSDVDPNLDVATEFQRSTRKLYRWLYDKYPKAAPHFKTKLNQYIELFKNIERSS